MSLIDGLESALVRLGEVGASSTLVGGLAVSSRTDPRFTRDADLAIAVADDDEAEAVVRHFVSSGYRLDALIEQEDAERLATARLTDPQRVSVDLLFASSGIEPEIVQASQRMEILPGVEVPVASVPHLMAMKLLSVAPGRETDGADLRALAAVASSADWYELSEAVNLIQERGFDRGRDLSQLLADFRADPTAAISSML